MEKERQIKLLSIVSLVLAISAMTLGFAAFSTTLNISSSAIVTPSSEDFKMLIYGFKDSSSMEKVYISGIYDDSDLSSTLGYGIATEYDAKAGVAVIDNSTHTISNATGEFENNLDQILYLFVLRNEGTYDAYLDLSEYNKISDGYELMVTEVSGVCTPGTGATASLVTEACKGVVANYGVFDLSTGSSKKITTDYFKIEAGSEEIIGISIWNLGPWADGSFTVDFPSIEFNVSTIK